MAAREYSHSASVITLLAELAEVIACKRFVQRVHAAGLSAADLVIDYQNLTILVDPEPLASPGSRDPDDDHVLACALAAHADLIVSGDRDLLVLDHFQDIRILTAAQALAILGT